VINLKIEGERSGGGMVEFGERIEEAVEGEGG